MLKIGKICVQNVSVEKLSIGLRIFAFNSTQKI